MNTKLFTTLYDEVLIDVPGVPADVALNAIRNTAIEFCDRTMCWVVDADPISSVAGQSIYQFEPENGSEVVGVIQAYYNGVRINPMTASQLDNEYSQPQSTFVAGEPWNEQIGVPRYYLIEQPEEFILVPIPSESVDSAIKMKVSLKPTRTSSGMERWVIDKYFDTLAHGAKARLCAMHKKPWTDSGQANFHTEKFEQGITAASAHSSHKLPAMVCAASPI